MAERNDSFDLVTLRKALKPFQLHWFPRLRSTSDHAAVMRNRGELFAPSVVLTGNQIAGRGRGGNTWWSGTGGLAVTFVLPIDEHLAPQQLPLLAGLAVRDAITEVIGNETIQLKWPNDLLFNDRKLAGLLCERVRKVDLIGIGINVNMRPSEPPRALRSTLTSLSQIAGRSIGKTPLLAAIARHLRPFISRRDEISFAQRLREYDRNHALRGRRVRVEHSAGEASIVGICEGIDSTGRLLVRSGDTINRIIAGHVQFAP